VLILQPLIFIRVFLLSFVNFSVHLNHDDTVCVWYAFTVTFHVMVRQ